MSETLSEQVLRVIADFEWIGTQRRLGEMWAMDIAALEAKLEAMEMEIRRIASDMRRPSYGDDMRLFGSTEHQLERMVDGWVDELEAAAQEEQEDD